MKAAPHVLTQRVGEELVLLDLNGETYFGLDPVGTRCWELLSAGSTPAQVVETLLAEYDVERERLVANLQSLINELTAQKLLVDESSADGQSA